jgi:hypothetical protein
MDIESLLEEMWQDYIKISPASKAIHDLFEKQGNRVVNDHIALRTFRHPSLGIEHLASSFLKMGSIEKGEYHFEQKKLYAKHYEWPGNSMPKIFISELKIEECSEALQTKVKTLVSQIGPDILTKTNFSCIGRPWEVAYETYQSLSQESEYAGWLSAFGFRPNHFTVSVNHLQTFNELSEVNEFLSGKGFQLNQSGGEIKGSPEQYLEQSSTLAQQVETQFSDGKFSVPSCYYEFAKRYPLPDASLYQGFVATSADKIFESTNRQS